MRERLTVCVAQIDLIDSLELGDVLVDYFIIGIIIVSIINFLLFGLKSLLLSLLLLLLGLSLVPIFFLLRSDHQHLLLLLHFSLFILNNLISFNIGR